MSRASCCCGACGVAVPICSSAENGLSVWSTGVSSAFVRSSNGLSTSSSKFISVSSLQLFSGCVFSGIAKKSSTARGASLFISAFFHSCPLLVSVGGLFGMRFDGLGGRGGGGGSSSVPVVLFLLDPRSIRATEELVVVADVVADCDCDCDFLNVEFDGS